MKKKKTLIIISLFLILLITSGIMFNLDFFDHKLSPTTLPEKPVESEHSQLYISGVSVEEVITYFNEVNFGAEIVNSGNPFKIQKWVEPIYYNLNGDYTDEDLLTLSKFTSWLNTIEGFPGIYETNDLNKSNFKIYFYNQQKMLDLMGKEFVGLDGAVTFWYDDDKIYNAIICYRTDLAQDLRNSVILEEIYNGIGPIQDTDLRSDSIIYSKFSKPQKLTDIDELILKILYNPRILPGMSVEECEEVIRELYY